MCTTPLCQGLASNSRGSHWQLWTKVDDKSGCRDGGDISAASDPGLRHNSWDLVGPTGLIQDVFYEESCTCTQVRCVLGRSTGRLQGPVPAFVSATRVKVILLHGCYSAHLLLRAAACTWSLTWKIGTWRNPLCPTHSLPASFRPSGLSTAHTCAAASSSPHSAPFSSSSWPLVLCRSEPQSHMKTTQQRVLGPWKARLLLALG